MSQPYIIPRSGEDDGEEQRLSRLATDLLRQLIDSGTPSIEVIAWYLGGSPDDVVCMAEGVQRMAPPARRNLARVALAFAPGMGKHTARRLLQAS